MCCCVTKNGCVPDACTRARVCMIAWMGWDATFGVEVHIIKYRLKVDGRAPQQVFYPKIKLACVHARARAQILCAWLCACVRMCGACVGATAHACMRCAAPNTILVFWDFE